jgi:hypothetical protein
MQQMQQNVSSKEKSQRSPKIARKKMKSLSLGFDLKVLTIKFKVLL